MEFHSQYSLLNQFAFIPYQKQRKLLLNRLRDSYNEAHDKYEVLYTDFTVTLQQDYQNEYDPSFAKEQTVISFEIYTPYSIS